MGSIFGIVLQNDVKIIAVVGSRGHWASGTKMVGGLALSIVLVRLNTNGIPDKSFGIDPPRSDPY